MVLTKVLEAGDRRHCLHMLAHRNITRFLDSGFLSTYFSWSQYTRLKTNSNFADILEVIFIFVNIWLLSEYT
jgi:hypothetical protein